MSHTHTRILTQHMRTICSMFGFRFWIIPSIEHTHTALNFSIYRQYVLCACTCMMPASTTLNTNDAHVTSEFFGHGTSYLLLLSVFRRVRHGQKECARPTGLGCPSTSTPDRDRECHRYAWIPRGIGLNAQTSVCQIFILMVFYFHSYLCAREQYFSAHFHYTSNVWRGALIPSAQSRTYQ